MRLQNHLFDGWRATCRAFGYEEYEGPTFEHLELYVGKSGEEIVGQLYHFMDKGGRELALRPELTPTFARMVNQKGSSLRKPLKWFSIPRLFRYERAQRGRLREFFQLNMDIVGCDTVAAEVDLISAVIEMLKGFGLTSNDFAVRISSRRVLSEMLGLLSVPDEKKPTVYAVLDKRAKIGPIEFNKLLLSEGLNPNQIAEIEAYFGCKTLPDLLELSHRWLELDVNPSVIMDATMKSKIGLFDLSHLVESLDSLGYKDFYELDMSIVRGLAYYTGIVFEVFDKGSNMRAIAGGGRYDNLLSKLGGESLSAVGFGMGDVVLADLLNEKGLLPQGRPGVDYYLADLAAQGGLPRLKMLGLAKRLRARGLSVSYSLKAGKFKKQMEEANDIGAKAVLFFGSDRAPEGKYEVKNLASGEQTILGEEDL